MDADETVYATADQLAATWRPLSPAEEKVATELLRYTSALLRQRASKLDQWIAERRVDPTLVQLAAILVVKRVMMNPEAARQKSFTTGPFTESITIDSAVSSNALYVSDEDLALFLPRTTAGKVGSVRLRAGLA